MRYTKLSRRDFLKLSAASGVSITSFGLLSKRAFAKESIVSVDWGPPYIDFTKKAGAKWNKANIIWELHSGGAASILPKIKSSWPNTPYDIITAWDPVFKQMGKEGWAEKITVSDVPNLADVPEGLITKDEQGNWISVPRSAAGSFFAYRPDICPIEITKVEDLLNPRLRGQICWPSPVMTSSMQVVGLALARDGDEYNIDPGWKFLKEIAKTGNIGRVFLTTSDAINSLTSGETSVTFADQGSLGSVANKVPLKYLTKTHETLKTFLYTEGYAILACSKKKKLAFDFANFIISPKINEELNKFVVEAPVNLKSSAHPSVNHLQFNNEELKKYAYLPDYDYVSKQMDKWVKRFEVEVTPLL